MTFEGLEIQPMMILTAIWVVIFIAILGFLVKFWPVIKGFVTAIENLKGLPEFMERTDSFIAESKSSQTRQDNELQRLGNLIDRIRDQVENHHDTNLRDDVTSALKAIEAMNAWTGRHEILSDAHRKQVQVLTEWVEAHSSKEDE